MKEIARNITAYVAAHEDELIDFLSRLVSIESTTYHEREAIEFISSTMRNLGYDEVRIDGAGNCLGRIGNGPMVILADAHVDTVEPGDPAAWGFDPLVPRIEHRTISGRGVVDDKGPLSALIFAGKAIKELGLGERLTYWVSASISEEDVEGSCVQAMMELNPSIKPDAIIVAESSDGHVIRGHKGRALIRMEVLGRAAHASEAHRGENALIKAIPMIEAIDKWKDLPEDPFLGAGSIEITKAICDTPSLNTIPGKVTVIADRRISCGESTELLLSQLEPMLALSDAQASVDTEEVTTYTGYRITQVDYFPSWVLEEEHPLIASAKESYRLVTDRQPVVTKWNFCTNATYLCGITGIPSVGYGPGDHGLCHSTKEILSFDELTEATAIYAMMAVHMAAVLD